MLRRDRASAGDLKTQAASPQWQRSRAAEQAAETEKVRGRRGGFLFFFLFFFVWGGQKKSADTDSGRKATQAVWGRWISLKKKNNTTSTLTPASNSVIYMQY